MTDGRDPIPRTAHGLSAGLPHSPAADRNKAPLLEVLRRVLAPSGVALEIAAGTGQHAAHFAAALPGWTWQPTDADPASLAVIAARCAGLANVRAPFVLDVRAAAWPGVPPRVDAVCCANLLHIAPWQATPALMRGAARHLAPGGVLVVYGPFLEDDVPTAAGNLAFDADLRGRDPAWGLRRLADVAAAARAAGLALRERMAMPANNLTLVFGRAAGADTGDADTARTDAAGPPPCPSAISAPRRPPGARGAAPAPRSRRAAAAPARP